MTSAPKILLTGATGMLGKNIFDILTDRDDIELYPLGRAEQSHVKNYIKCDISDTYQFNSILDKLKPEYVLHCAAEVNVNLCETEQDRVYRLHVQASEAIASKSFIQKSIYISTDSVFDGRKGDYSENDAKTPLNYYAKTKSLGEDMFLAAQHNSVIIRTNIIGFSEPSKTSLFEWGFQNLNQMSPISGFLNVIFNPLYVKTLAGILINKILFENVANGVYNFGSSDYNSKYDFLKIVAKTFNFDQHLITPVEADTSGKNALRPLNTTLNVKETEKKLNIKFPSLQQEVSQIQKDLKQMPC